MLKKNAALADQVKVQAEQNVALEDQVKLQAKALLDLEKMVNELKKKMNEPEIEAVTPPPAQKRARRAI